MVAKLISNLSVFIVLGWRKRPAIVRLTDGQTDRQAEADRQTKRLRIRVSLPPIESVGFY